MIRKFVFLSVILSKNSFSTNYCSLERIYTFVSSNYGAQSGKKFKDAIEEAYDQNGMLTEAGREKVKEIFIVILQREIAKTYKIPNNVSKFTTKNSLFQLF